MSLTIQSSRFIHLALDCRIDLGIHEEWKQPTKAQQTHCEFCAAYTVHTGMTLKMKIRFAYPSETIVSNALSTCLAADDCVTVHNQR